MMIAALEAFGVGIDSGNSLHFCRLSYWASIGNPSFQTIKVFGAIFPAEIRRAVSGLNLLTTSAMNNSWNCPAFFTAEMARPLKMFLNSQLWPRSPHSNTCPFEGLSRLST
jgi:hypothetical protein